MSLNEKDMLLPADHKEGGARSSSSISTWRIVGIFMFSILGMCSTIYQRTTLDLSVHDHLSKSPLCPQETPLAPKKNGPLAQGLDEVYQTESFKQKAIDWLAGAVKISTESFDSMDAPGVDPRWEIFSEFHKYLRTAFPLVHEKLEVTEVNTHGLVYRWEGNSPSLKPLLLLAHQDVVPVNKEVLSDWKYPPYSGHFDGKYVWGRGSCDDKSGLISTFIALESLLSQDFTPTRTVFFASGFDEEASGTYGARAISEYLLDKYGENHFAMLVDEGGRVPLVMRGHGLTYGARFAQPGVGEKGYMDVRIEVSSPGGHSSVPPKHTSIGFLAAALVHLEAHPATPHLSRSSPMYSTLLCQAEHAPDMPESLTRLLGKSNKSDQALRLAEKILFHSDEATIYRAFLGTTQAVDLIEGGVKVNALPERAQAIVNHRISTDSNIAELFERLTKVMGPVAKKLNLGFEAFGVNVTTTKCSHAGTLRISDAWNKGLEPAPISPTDAAPFKLLAGTIRQTWATGIGKDTNESIFVAPSMMSGNTDTRYFWRLTPHIFRYNHIGQEDVYGGVHTTNEAITISGFVEEVRFFTNLILNADESDL